MEEFSDVRFKQLAVFEFLTAQKFIQLKFTDECKAFMVISVLISVQYSKSAVRKWFQKQNTIFFKDRFQKLLHRWRKCIEVRCDFVEKQLRSFENN